MSETTTLELRELASRIATSYTKANPTPVQALPEVIQLAYQGLLSCTRPPAPPPQAPARKRRGRRSRDT
ncbi:hypothetical protein [Rhodospirillum centenum]|uniref:Transcriptional regulatory protein, putative n=1 Tax=Rhodospirillum centenum (strain ATCC 51521 / SW) TaxID=414684 RepID=B6INE0_RHOCS|nr:hypothetical protein [Rhodospirillum centenum]ACI99037.1 transcriptional regulatory protein, putative [Rhodospirillum centenum SW]